MPNFRPVIPSVFTMGNLFCGFLSIMSAYDGEAVQACWFIILGFFLDGLDGFVARVSRADSQFGVELDSLADLVSFGIAPAMIFYSFRFKDLGKWGWVLGFVYVMCGAVRLARFNLGAGPRKFFQGLPIPAAAAALTGYTLASYQIWGQLEHVKVLVILILGCSFLMVSSIEYEKRPLTFHTTKDRIKWLYMVVGGIALLIFHELAIFPLILIYIVYGLVREAVLLVRTGGPVQNDHEEAPQQYMD